MKQVRHGGAQGRNTGFAAPRRRAAPARCPAVLSVLSGAAVRCGAMPVLPVLLGQCSLTVQSRLSLQPEEAQEARTCQRQGRPGTSRKLRGRVALQHLPTRHQKHMHRAPPSHRGSGWVHRPGCCCPPVPEADFSGGELALLVKVVAIGEVNHVGGPAVLCGGAGGGCE